MQVPINLIINFIIAATDSDFDKDVIDVRQAESYKQDQWFFPSLKCQDLTQQLVASLRGLIETNFVILDAAGIEKNFDQW